MECDEIKRFMTTELGATTNLNKITVQVDDSSSECSTEPEITTTTHKSMMRKLKITKAVPLWSIPTAAWLIAAESTTTIVASVWNDLAHQDALPNQWEEMQTVRLKKPGKDASKMENRRAINLTDPAFKGYLNFIQSEIRQYKEGKWKPTTYGGVPFGSAPLAIMIVQEIMARLKMAENTSSTWGTQPKHSTN